MSSEPEKCCLCVGAFDLNNFPRLMPSCDHSVCTKCLEKAFENSLDLIQCSICRNREQILEAHFQYFPKNISLIKMIKDSANLKMVSPQFTNQTKAHQNLQKKCEKTKLKIIPDFAQHGSSTLIIKTDDDICSIHKKQTEIICLSDFTKLCPMCAVFGSHKDHNLKTIQETTMVIDDALRQFSMIKDKKKKIQTKIKNPEFKSEIAHKLKKIKESFSLQIKQKFKVIYEAVATAQRNANQDLFKCFKQLSDKINKLAKQQSYFESYFNQWSRNIELQLAQTTRLGIGFQKKAQIFFNGPIKSMKESEFYLQRIEQFTSVKKLIMSKIPESLKIETRQNIIKEIQNYLTVKCDQISFIVTNQSLLSSNFGNGKDLKIQSGQIYLSKQDSIKYFGNINSSINLMDLNLPKETINNKSIKVQFSSSQHFFSPKKYQTLVTNVKTANNLSLRKKSPREKSRSLPKSSSSNNFTKFYISPSKKQPLGSNQKQKNKNISITTEEILETFITDDKLDTLDLSSFDLPDNQMIFLLEYANSHKRIKCLKLSQNKLTTEGFSQILPFLKSTTNLNLGNNLLTEQVLNILMKNKEKAPNLRILNLAHNKVNERKAKVYVEELKKQGTIVTL